MQYFNPTISSLFFFSLLVSIAHLKINVSSRNACRFELNALEGSPKIGAILVFGAKAVGDSPSLELKSRLDLAFKFWEQSSTSLIVLSGGIVNGTKETLVMQNYLTSRGVPILNLFQLDSSFNTRETVISFSRLSKDISSPHFLAISSPYHSLRIQIEARRMKLSLQVASDGNSPENKNRRVLRVRTVTEIFAIVFYLLPYPITRRVPTSATSLRHKIPNLLIKMGS
jgi:uncharacterized SAM-binding protein YcdF (DUF218 family)